MKWAMKNEFISGDLLLKQVFESYKVCYYEAVIAINNFVNLHKNANKTKF